MKTTFKSSEIAHAWFHALAPYGKCPSAVTFDGDTLFSYNTAIARKVTHKGKQAVIINDRTFSVTTSSHQSDMRQALPTGTQKFYVSESQGARLHTTPEHIFQYAIDQATQKATEALAPRIRQNTRDTLLAQQATWLERAKEVSTFYGLRKKVDEKTIARLADKKAKIEKAAKITRVKREKAQAAEYLQAFEDWKLGGSEYFPAHASPVAFRIDDEEMVSTKGARVSVATVKRILPALLSRKAAPERVDIPVDGYRINSLTPQGIVAGCHSIAWSELERIAAMVA